MDQVHAYILQEKQEEAQKVEVGETLEESCQEVEVIKEELDFLLEQVENAEIIEEEEVVEDLGDAEPPWETQVIEPPSKTFEFDVEEGVQPLRHVMVEDLEEVDQEMDSIINEFLSTIESSPIELEDEVNIEEACQEVEIIKEEHKGVELARPLKIPLPKPLPSNTTLKWVNSLSLNFTFPLEYGLLKTDGQLRDLCGFKSKKWMVNGWQYNPRFVMVGCLRSKCKGW